MRAIFRPTATLCFPTRAALTTICITFSLVATACTHITPPPAWCHAPSQDNHYYGYSQRAVGETEAIEDAKALAFSKFAAAIGTRVQSQFQSSTDISNDEYSKKVKIQLSTQSEPIEVREFKVHQQFTAADSRSTYHACVDLIVPEEEHLRLKTIALGKTVLAMECEFHGQPEQKCPVEIITQLEAALTHVGIKLTPMIGHESREKTLKHAQDAKAGFIIYILLRSRFIQERHGEFFAEASAKVERIGVADEVSIVTIENQPVTGGQYSKDKAEMKALNEVVSALIKKLSPKSLGL